MKNLILGTIVGICASTIGFSILIWNTPITTEVIKETVKKVEVVKETVKKVEVVKEAEVEVIRYIEIPAQSRLKKCEEIGGIYTIYVIDYGWKSKIQDYCEGNLLLR